MGIEVPRVEARKGQCDTRLPDANMSGRRNGLKSMSIIDLTISTPYIASRIG